MSATRQPPDRSAGASRAKPARKLGRPFKAPPAPSRKPRELPEAGSATNAVSAPALPPPSIPFRSFKVALSTLKERGAIPDQLDRSVWTNKLFGTNLHDTIEAYRFLGLIDQASEPTPAFASLIDALDGDSWSAELRRVLERSYQPLLACSISALTAGGLLRTFRTIYRTPGETTRKCCNFFVHAAREAALDIGPFLLTNSRSQWINGQRLDRREAATSPTGSSGLSVDQANAESLKSLIDKFPAYDSGWSDDVKRLWLGTFNELLRRLEN